MLLSVGITLDVYKRQIVSFEEVERHERHDAMAVRRKFPYVIASVIDADGIDPFRIPCGEVFFPKRCV